jgi:hypothetical protein
MEEIKYILISRIMLPFKILCATSRMILGAFSGIHGIAADRAAGGARIRDEQPMRAGA